MGAWSEKPLGNDCACDWIDEHIGEVCVRTINDPAARPEEKLAAMHVLERLGRTFHEANYAKAFEEIERYATESRWTRPGTRASVVSRLKKKVLSW